MKRLIRSAACALVCLAASLFPASLEAQNTSTNVTLSSVLIGATGSTSTPMPYGTVCAVAVNAQGVPVTITATGWGLVPAGRKFCGKVVNGAIAGGFSVPDSLHTNASAPIAYNLVIQQTDGLNGNPVGSPTTISAVYGITGASFALDAYAPPVSAPVTSTVLGYGASVPTSCTAPSIWTTTTGAAYVCSNGAYVALSGSGGSGITQLTGDGRAGPGTGTQPFTLNTVNTAPGTCGDATHVPQITTVGKGFVTNCVPVAISAGTGNGTGTGTVPAGARFQIPTYQADGTTLAATTVPEAVAQFPGSVADVMGRYANNGIALNKAMFSDGSGHYYCAGPAYCPNGIYIDDFTLTLSSNPSAFDPADVINIIHAFIAARNAHGEIPLSMWPDKTAPSYMFYSGYDQYQHYAAVDGWLGVVWDLYTWCHMPGVTTAACNAEYSADASIIRTALAYFPKDATYHMPAVTAGNEWVASTLFMEVMRNTGQVANGSVWYEFALDLLNKLATQAGDSTNASFFSTEKALVDSGIQATLIDASGMLKTATGQNSANLDVQTSVLWAYLGYGTAPQRTAIANYISTNYGTLVDSEGYILNSPTTWAFSGCIPSGGGAPYIAVGTAGCYDPSQAAPFYQWGRWSHDFNWFASVLAMVNPRQAQTMVEAFAHGTNPQAEWHASNSIAPGGTSPNMESPMGAYAFARSNPLITSPLDTNPATKERFFTQHDWTKHTLSFMHQDTPTSPIITSLTLNNTNASGTVETLLSGNSTSEVLDIRNLNPAGPSAISFNGASNDGNAGGIGYANSAHALTWLRNHTYIFDNLGSFCFANITLGRCQMTTNPDGSTTVNGNLTVTGTVTGVIAYGTPTIAAGNAGGAASFGTAPWPLNDHIMTVVWTPSTNVTTDLSIAQVTFGKTWVDGAGNPVFPNCTATPRLAPAAGEAFWIDTNAGAIGTSLPNIYLRAGAGNYVSGTTYAWMIQCEGINER